MSDAPPIDKSTDDAAAQPTKSKRGRPRWVPTDRDREQIKAMAGMGLNAEEISVVIGVSAPTLLRACRADLRSGATQANLKVAASLYRHATDPSNRNPAAAIYWTKARMGWRDQDAKDGSESPSKKAERQEAARRVVGSGKLAPGKPPKLKVVGGRREREQEERS